eukprot:gb/GFBE01069009.1/.p1 GENE.gb/GFBE01069009.1/~~gb/GFBE01069009.1/.p1  ORF type:complete len:518 (+),score=75.72 gb/GFBE01069009.1/:1-1554(+)
MDDVRNVFLAWDTDGNGMLSEVEFTTVLRQLGFTTEEASRIFSEANTKTEEAELSYDDFLAWIFSEISSAQETVRRVNAATVFREPGRLQGGSAHDTEVPLAAGNITAEELDEIAQFRRGNPPRSIKSILEATNLVLNASSRPRAKEPPQWNQVRKMLADRNFAERMLSFDIEALRRAPVLSAFLVSNYFGAGGLTYGRVRRASPVASNLFKWCTMELASVGAMPLPEYEAGDLEAVESDKDLAAQDNEWAVAHTQEDLVEEVGTLADRNSRAPRLCGTLADLPDKSLVVEPDQIMLLAMTGSGAMALDLALLRDKTGPCAKCDGAHHEDECPYFEGSREEWEDWAKERGALDASSGKESSTRSTEDIKGTKVQQPGDGSCLFHSLAWNMRRLGVGSGSVEARGLNLRQELVRYLEVHADDEVCGTSYRDYIWWDRGLTVQDYVKEMGGTSSLWGGAVEISAFTRMYDMNVSVYETLRSGRFRCVCAFEAGPECKTYNIVYTGKSHYDALLAGFAVD